MAKILVVDDRPTNRQFLTTLLGYGGHRLLEAADGAEALALVRAERPDLVITDILMPTMDGFELAKSVRAELEIAATNIIFYTATYRAQEAMLLAKACGVSTVIAKPAEPQRVLDVVNEQLGIPVTKPVPRAGSKRKEGEEGQEIELSELGVQLTDHVNDLRGLKAQLDGIVERSRELEVERERLRGISTKFAQNIAQLHTTSARLYALVETGMDLAAERDPQRMLELFAAASRRMLGASTAVALVLRPTEDLLQLVASDGFDSGAEAAMREINLNEGLVAEVLATRKVVLAAAMPGAEALAGLPEGHPPATSFLGISVSSASGCYGVVFFTDKAGGGQFDENDERMAQALAAQLAITYENFVLYDMVQRHAAELQLEIEERNRVQAALGESEARFRQMAEHIRDAFYLRDLYPPRMLYMSDAYERIWGHSRESLYADERLWVETIHADDRERALHVVSAGMASGEYDYEYRIVRPDGEVRWIHGRGFPIRDATGKVYRIAGVAADITERKRAEQLRALEHGVTRCLAGAESASAGIQAVIRTICEAEEWLCGRHFMADEAAGVLRFAGAWSTGEPAAEEFIGRSREHTYQRGQDLSGTVWETGEPLWVADVTKDARASGARAVSGPTLQGGAFVLPLKFAGKTLGVLSFSSRKTREPDERFLQAIAAIGSQIGQYLARLQAETAMRNSEAALRRAEVVAKLAHVVTVSGGDVESYSETFPGLIGADPAEMVRTTRGWLDCLHPEDRELFRRTSIEAAASGERRDTEYRLQHRNGEWIHLRHVMEPVQSHPHVPESARWFSTLQDITEQKRSEDKIRRLNRVYAVLSGINSLIVRASSRDELFGESCRIAVKDGNFGIAWIGAVDASKDAVAVAWAGIDAELGARKIALGGPVGAGLYGSVLQEKKPAFNNDLRPQEVKGHARGEEALRRGYRSAIILPLIVRDEVRAVMLLFAKEPGFFNADELTLLEELAGDISFALDHIEKAEKLEYLAYYDALTGLANRTLFQERLAQYVRTAKAEGRRLALVIMDVERFKTINDSLGRHAADELLKQVAGRLTADSADGARFARIGADHFAMVVPEVRSAEEFGRIAEAQVTRCFGTPYRLGDTELRVAVKAGIAMFPDDAADPEGLFKNAEAALKKAKVSSERYLFYTQQMTERVAEKLTLENQMRQALEKEEFVLHYQPKVDLEKRRIVGLEALIRWQSPKRGLVPPGQFISLLEETGLILEVGAWALKRASLDHRSWAVQKLKPPRVAVNVSAIQLRQRDFVKVVEQAIMDGVAPTGIDLEITESLVMEDVEANIAKLKSVRALGVRIAIDDFGTGYSSLGYLAKLPVQSLKIDRSFIINMHSDPDAMSLISTIISLAHSLRLSVIAEGVETEEQAKFLRLLRCDEMQGYLFSKPVSFDDITGLLKKS